jgi:hypothetical protein
MTPASSRARMIGRSMRAIGGLVFFQHLLDDRVEGSLGEFEDATMATRKYPREICIAASA